MQQQSTWLPQPNSWQQDQSTGSSFGGYGRYGSQFGDTMGAQGAPQQQQPQQTQPLQQAQPRGFQHLSGYMQPTQEINGKRFIYGGQMIAPQEQKTNVGALSGYMQNPVKAVGGGMFSRSQNYMR